MKKSVKRFFRISGLLLIILLGLAIGATAIFQNQIGNRLLRELNDQLEAKLEVEDVKLALFSNFPNAAINLNGVLLNDNQGGILLESKQISFKIGLFSLLRSNYKIGSVKIREGALNLSYNAAGKPNYTIFKNATDTLDTNEKSSFNVDLEEAVLNDMELIYANEFTQQFINLLLDKARFSGQITDNQLNLVSDAEFTSRFVDVGSIRYLPGKEVAYSADIQINLDKEVYQFNKVEARLGQNVFKIDGAIEKMERGPFYDLYVLSEQGSIQGVLQLLPAEYLEYLGDFSSKGNFKFDALIRGQLAPNIQPEVRASLTLDKGSINSPRLSNELKEVSFLAEYNNGKYRDRESSVLEIKNFSGYFNRELAEMALRIDNFKDPQIDFQLDGALPLNAIYGLFNSPSVTAGAGEIEIKNLRLKGAYADMIRTNRISRVETSGVLEFDDASLTMNKEKLILDRGTLTLTDNQMILKDLKLEGAGSEFELQGTAFNLIPVLFADSLNSQQAELEFKVDLNAEELDLDRLLVASNLKLEKADTLKKDSLEIEQIKQVQIANRERLTRLLKGTFQTRVKQFNFNKLTGENFSGLVSFDNQIMQIRGSTNTMEGIVQIDGKMEFAETPRLSANLVLEEINIQQLFQQSNNFQQTMLTEKHISGMLSSHLLINSFWDRQGNFLMDKLQVLADLDINNGTLQDFELLKGFSSFVKIKDLQQIKFLDLKNYLEIRKQTLYIPAMFIQSNALNLTLSGEHRFDQEFDYYLKVNAGQVLTEKFKKYDPTLQAKKARKKGFFNLHYNIKGNADDYVYKAAKRQVKTEFDRSNNRKIEIQQALQAAFEGKTFFTEPLDWLDEDGSVMEDQ